MMKQKTESLPLAIAALVSDATSNDDDVCVDLPPAASSAPQVGVSSFASHDPLRKRKAEVVMFDGAVPDWLMRVTKDRTPVKYSEIERSLKRLGQITNKSGSMRHFTFNQTPNGEYVQFHFHQPHDDEVRSMADFYLKFIIDGFQRAGYSW